MPLLRLLNTTTFRLALIYMIFFAVSVFALLVFVYWSTADFMAEQVDETIQTEIVGLSEQYRTGGIRRLIQVIQNRSRQDGDGLYLLAQPDGTQVAGNLSIWPDNEVDEENWVDFTFERPVDEGTATHNARARIFTVENRFQLLVGRDIQGRLQTTGMIRSTLGWAMAVTAALGLIGGALLARYVMGRLEEVNRTARRIISGDLSQRVPLRGSGDEIDQLAENLNDMLAQIERLMMGMRQVTDNIAHDLRSPLNRMRSRLEVTLLEDGNSGTYEEALRLTIDEADDLIKTFNALLSIAQIEAGSLREGMTDVDVSAIARDVAELYEPAAEEAEIMLTMEIADGVHLHGGRELISQALANLLDNAIKYAGQDGKVLVSLKERGDNVILTVTDSGPGIPADQRENVTKRFVRLEDSRSAPGAGLGLSLVAAVARLHEGELVLGEGSDGKGLSARLTLPTRRAD